MPFKVCRKCRKAVKVSAGTPAKSVRCRRHGGTQQPAGPEVVLTFDDPAAVDGPDLSTLTIDELKVRAERDGVDLTGTRTKPQMLARFAEAAAAGDQDESPSDEGDESPDQESVDG